MPCPESTRSEKEKMLAEELYDPFDEELVRDRLAIRRLCLEFEAENNPESKLLDRMVRSGGPLSIVPPFHCDYGYNIILGENCSIGRNCVILDVAYVRIGSNTILENNVGIYTAGHTLDYAERAAGVEFGKSITIGSDVLVGANAVICPGVTIGDRVIIDPGSIVTKNIASDCHVGGNPARVIPE